MSMVSEAVDRKVVDRKVVDRKVVSELFDDTREVNVIEGLDDTLGGEVIDYEQWLWDREKAIEERWELMEVASKCPFKVCPVEIEVAGRPQGRNCEFIDGGGI